MALIKEITTPQGIKADYWRVELFRIDRAKSLAQIVLMPYLSQQSRMAGCEPLFDKAYNLHVEDLVYPEDSPYAGRTLRHYSEYFAPDALEGKDVYKVIYGYIKTHVPEFQTAVDA